ncbi:hypothetical protein HDV00_000024 [Rhizophlyctis rosea]|nr:hypothetical protein HDV00_000024 [Rhizophlyctis rosea]
MSRACAIVADYKILWEEADPEQIEGFQDSEDFETPEVHRINEFVLDIVNCLWRSKALLTDRERMTGFGVSNELLKGLSTLSRTLGINLPSAFNMSGPSLMLYAMDFAEQTIKEMGIKTRRSRPARLQVTAEGLKTEDDKLILSYDVWRVGMVTWYREQRLTGLSFLLLNCIRQLRMPAGAQPSRPVDPAAMQQ